MMRESGRWHAYRRRGTPKEYLKHALAHILDRGEEGCLQGAAKMSDLKVPAQLVLRLRERWGIRRGKGGAEGMSQLRTGV